MGIGSLDVSTPAGGSYANLGPARIKEIKQALLDSFPGFTAGDDVLQASAPDLDAAVNTLLSLSSYGCVYQSSLLDTPLTAGTWTIVGGLLVNDSGEAGSIDAQGASNRIAVTESGVYFFSFGGDMSATDVPVSQKVTVGIAKNSSVIGQPRYQTSVSFYGTLASAGGGFSRSGVIQLAASDYLQLTFRPSASSFPSGVGALRLEGCHLILRRLS